MVTLILSSLLISSSEQVFLSWVCLRVAQSFPAFGVSKQVNEPLTPHHWLAWLIRQQSTLWSPLPPLFPPPSPTALYFCQMVSMQSWEQRKIKGRLQRLKNPRKHSSYLLLLRWHIYRLHGLYVEWPKRRRRQWKTLHCCLWNTISIKTEVVNKVECVKPHFHLVVRYGSVQIVTGRTSKTWSCLCFHSEPCKPEADSSISYVIAWWHSGGTHVFNFKAQLLLKGFLKCSNFYVYSI